MARNQIYEITILNWDKHNQKHKQSFKKTLIANNFCTDAKIQALPLSVAWMYLGILLIGGNDNQGTIKVHSRTINELLKSKLRANQGLDLLQQYQLVSYHEITSLKGIEVKLNEVKLNEVKGSVEEIPAAPPKPKKSVKKSAELLEPESSAALKLILGDDFVTAQTLRYPEIGWVDDEIENAYLHSIAKEEGKRSKKGWIAFVTGWLKRGWGWRQKSNSGNPRNTSTASNGTARTYSNQRTESENNFFKTGSETLIGGEK